VKTAFAKKPFRKPQSHRDDDAERAKQTQDTQRVQGSSL
jgi:hypothetical protein